MFRFTIRDVLWLTVVVALALGWSVNWAMHSPTYRHSVSQRDAALSDAKAWQRRAELMKVQLEESGWRIEFDSTKGGGADMTIAGPAK